MKFHDTGKDNWKELWHLDGEIATVVNTKKGMHYAAGPENKNDAHHAVLWTKNQFKGDVKIEFDALKAARNLAKHGVTFDEAVAVLYDPKALSIEDVDSCGEHRWVSIEMNWNGQLLTVVYTYRAETIRIISARKATRREAKSYA